MKAMFKHEIPCTNGRMKILTFMLLVAVLAMASVFAIVINRAEVNQSGIVDSSEQMLLSQDLAGLARYAASGDASGFARLRASRDRFEEIIATQMAVFKEASGKTGTPESHALAELDDRWREFRYHIDELLDGQPPAVAAGNIGAQAEALFDAAKKFNGLLKAAPGNSLLRKELAYFLAVVALLLLFWRAFEQHSSIRKAELDNASNQQAITRLLDEMGDLAGGDLTVHTTVSGGFTGSIADAINVTVDSLRGLVKTINDTSTRLSLSVQETEAIAGNLLTASKQQSRDITDASTAINAMSNSMNDVSSNAGESSRVAMRSVEVARNGGEAVQRTMNGMDTIREHIQETSKRIKRLGESSQEIGDIVELINDIAEQTNILALNASIQAAMAGEAGRGFAVVADEVQRLAERSANATRQIEALVKTIQADTNEAVISMEKSTAGVVKGAQLAENASSSLEEIESISEQLAGLIQNISNSSRSQAEAASDLTATIQGIQQVTNQAASGTEQTSRSIGNLSRLAQDLDTSVAGFKLPQ